MVAANLAMRWSLSDIWSNPGFLETASAVATLALVVGAIIEYWVKLKPLSRLMLKWVLFRSTAFERCTLRRLFLHTLGPLLVVVGIGGELVFETRTFIVEDAAFDAEKESHEPRHVTPAQAACIKDALNGMSDQKLILVTWPAREVDEYTRDIARAFAQVLVENVTVDDESDKDVTPDRTGILLHSGGSQSFSDATYKALNCLVPSGAPKIDRPGSHDPKEELRVSVFPDSSRRASPR